MRMVPLLVAGEAVTPRPLPGALLPVNDLRGRVTGQRTIVLSEGEVQGQDVFHINGKPFDPTRDKGMMAMIEVAAPSGGYDAN